MIYGHRVFVILIYVLKINHRGKPWSLETNNHYAYHKYLIYRGKPCSFRLVPSGPPEPPTGCVTNNFTYSSFTVNMMMMLMINGAFFYWQMMAPILSPFSTFTVIMIIMMTIAMMVVTMTMTMMIVSYQYLHLLTFTRESC